MSEEAEHQEEDLELDVGSEEFADIASEFEFKDWVIDNTPFPSEASEGISAPGIVKQYDKLSHQRIKNILTKMVKWGILSRRQRVGYQDHFMIAPSRARAKEMVREAAIKRQRLAIDRLLNKAGTHVAHLRELSKKNQNNTIHVWCDCGKFNKFEVVIRKCDE